MGQTDRLNGLTGSVAIKVPVKVATTANITLSGAQTIDGVAVVADDRVLVKDQTDATENGIYDVSSSAWTRAADWDGTNDIVQGTNVYVQQGTLASGAYFKVSTADPITIGTTEVTLTATSSLVDAATKVLAGIIELATNAEGIAGTDDVRAVTAAVLNAVLAEPPAIGGTTPGAITGTTINATEFIGALTGNADTATKVGVLNVKVIEIGDWNMNITANIDVAHGLTKTKIRSISALIRDDNDFTYSDLSETDGSNTGVNGIRTNLDTNIRLSREIGGVFDNTTYNLTPYNRGWITIWYID